MLREKKIQAIRRTLGREEFSKGEEFIFFCPRCKHKKPKLSVNLSTDRFNCWVCSFSSKSLVSLFEKGSKERKEYLEEIKPKKVEDKQVYENPVLPDEFRTLSKKWKSPYYEAAMKYLFDRGVTFEDILLMKLGYCEEGEYKNRILIPSFDEFGELNFVTSRSFYDGQKKYKNGNYDKDIIFNDYLIDWSKPIVITEGPFDALKAKENAIPLQGSSINVGSKLFHKIMLTGVETYFAMDNDAFLKQLAIIEEFISYGLSCRYVDICDKKDVGEMTHDEFKIAKSNAVEIRSNLSVLRLRVMNA